MKQFEIKENSLPLANIGTAATNIHAACGVHFIFFKRTALLPQLKRIEKKGEGFISMAS